MVEEVLELHQQEVHLEGLQIQVAEEAVEVLLLQQDKLVNLAVQV